MQLPSLLSSFLLMECRHDSRSRRRASLSSDVAKATNSRATRRKEPGSLRTLWNQISSALKVTPSKLLQERETNI